MTVALTFTTFHDPHWKIEDIRYLELPNAEARDYRVMNRRIINTSIVVYELEEVEEAANE